MDSLLLIRYGEIALKGKNRPFFERKLLQNIRTALKGLEPFKLDFRRGRYYVRIARENLHAAQKRLCCIFGIVSISTVFEADLDLEDISRKSLELIKQHCRPGMSFKVETKRPNKRFPYTSPQINTEVGAFIMQSGLDLSVDVHKPELLLTIEVRDEGAYIYTSRLRGPGGLPVGVSGRGLLLLSGGIDSPVAGWMALKRGIELEAIHFHSPPFTGEAALNKVVDLCQLLAEYGGRVRLHLVHFTDIQKEIRLRSPEEMAITIMRRYMMKIAERTAHRMKARVLYTGESLGQVSSQTLDNIAVIDNAVSLPVLRPLIGLDKDEITAIARKINSYDISTRPHEDCCTLFVPQHPSTRPSLERVQAAEEKLGEKELIEAALEKIEARVIYPAYFAALTNRNRESPF